MKNTSLSIPETGLFPITFLIVLYTILRSGAVIITVHMDFFKWVEIGILAAMCIYAISQGIRFRQGPIFILIAMIVWILLNAILMNDSNFESYMALAIRLCLTLLIATTIPFREFRKYFAIIVSVLAAASLVFVILQPLLFQVYAQAPIISNTEIANYRNWWIWLVRLEAPDRNTGIFWEPGAYQIFLNLALIFVLFDDQSKLRNKFLLSAVLTISIFTTYSTVGYIACLLIYAANTTTTIKGFSCLGWVVMLFGMIIVIAAFLSFVVENPRISSKFTQGELNYGSFEARFNATRLDMELMNTNILAGTGISNFTAKRSFFQFERNLYTRSSSNTYTMIGAMFGIVMLLLYASQQIRLCWRLSPNLLAFPFLAVAIIIFFATQNFFVYLLSHLLFWYGVVDAAWSVQRDNVETTNPSRSGLKIPLVPAISRRYPPSDNLN